MWHSPRRQIPLQIINESGRLIAPDNIGQFFIPLAGFAIFHHTAGFFAVFHQQWWWEHLPRQKHLQWMRAIFWPCSPQKCDHAVGHTAHFLQLLKNLGSTNCVSSQPCAAEYYELNAFPGLFKSSQRGRIWRIITHAVVVPHLLYSAIILNQVFINDATQVQLFRMLFHLSQFHTVPVQMMCR